MKFIRMGFNPDSSEDAPTFEQVSELLGATILEFGALWCGHYRRLAHIKLYDGKGKFLGRAFKVNQRIPK